MILTTIDNLPGAKIVAHRGMVSGSTVRAKNAFLDIGATLKNAIGGELVSYTELLSEARNEAIERMVRQAEILKANAIINIRLATSAVSAGAAEIYAYGTAVVVEREEQ